MNGEELLEDIEILLEQSKALSQQSSLKINKRRPAPVSPRKRETTRNRKESPSSKQKLNKSSNDVPTGPFQTREQLENCSFADIFRYIQSLQEKVVTLEKTLQERDNTICILRKQVDSPKHKQSSTVEEDFSDDDPLIERQLSSFLEEEENPKFEVPAFGKRSHSSIDLRVTAEKASKKTQPNSNLMEHCPTEEAPKPAVGIQNLKEQWESLPDLILSCGGYNIENGCFPNEATNFIETNRRYYESFFLGKEHINIISRDTPWKTVIASVSKERFHYRVLLRSKIEDAMYLIEKSSVDKGFKSFARKLFRNISPSLGSCKWHTVPDETLKKDLMTFEAQMFQNRFKVGVLLAKDGQRKEEEMFCNESGSPAYEDFLNFIGDKIELEGWKYFSGGLDTRTKTTGQYSIFRRYREYEIMFHVSTLLPFYPSDPQQVERKRHLGNDIVVILFLEGDVPYKPTLISSNFIHSTIVVQPLCDGTGKTTHYRVWCVSKDTVLPFGPNVPNPPIFEKNEAFKEFLYEKLINAELACYKSEQFAQKLQPTRETYLNEIAQRYLK